jgi:hypothetical protein
VGSETCRVTTAVCCRPVFLLSAIVSFLIAFAAPVAGQTTYAPVFNPVNGHWYQQIRVPSGITWAEARSAAEAMLFAGYRGHLATMNSREENDFVWNSVLNGTSPLPQYWIGGFQDPTAPDYREPGGGWRWVTGEPWDHTRWNAGEPNNAGSENALEFLHGGVWNDGNGAGANRSYIVEYEPAPVPSAARLSILPNPVVSGATTVGLLTLDRAAGPEDIVLSLTSGLPAAVVVPAVVIVPAGANRAAFSIVTFPVSAPTTVTLAASGPGGMRTAVLHVLPMNATFPPGNLLANGSVEQPRVPDGQPRVTLRDGELSGWRVTRGTVDLVRAGWQQAPSEGAQSLELMGTPGPATVEQSVATVPGRDYLLAGWVGHNPRAPGDEARANVFLNGQFFVQLFHRDATATAGAMGWQPFAYRFRATAATTMLTFADATNADKPVGLALDGLAVTAVLPNLLVNGSFETPIVPEGAGSVTLPSAGSLLGWRITRGSVDVTHARSRQQAPGQGLQSLDLAGTAGAGAVEQSVPTEPGRLYLFSGWLAHDPVALEGRAHMFVNGDFLAELFHSNRLYGVATTDEMGWQPFLYLFRATAPTTTLQVFDASELGETSGAVLDGLVIAPAEEPISGQPPAAPSGLTVRRISPTQVDLTWSDNSADEAEFEIERRIGTGDWARIARVATDSTRFSDFGVRPGTTYAYRVRALNEAGASAWSNEASVTTLPGP